MTLSFLQIILLIVLFAFTVLEIFRDGREKPTVNFYISALFLGFESYVLLDSNFFELIDWPQIVWLALACMGLFSSSMNHGKKIDNRYHGPAASLGFIFVMTIYYFGGFFS